MHLMQVLDFKNGDHLQPNHTWISIPLEKKEPYQEQYGQRHHQQAQDYEVAGQRPALVG